jgi:hypothetical protein
VNSSDPRGLSRAIAETVIEAAACEVSASKLLMNEFPSRLSLQSFRDWGLDALSPECLTEVTGSSCVLFARFLLQWQLAFVVSQWHVLHHELAVFGSCLSLANK